MGGPRASNFVLPENNLPASRRQGMQKRGVQFVISFTAWEGVNVGGVLFRGRLGDMRGLKRGIEIPRGCRLKWGGGGGGVLQLGNQGAEEGQIGGKCKIIYAKNQTRQKNIKGKNRRV